MYTYFNFAIYNSRLMLIVADKTIFNIPLWLHTHYILACVSIMRTEELEMQCTAGAFNRLRHLTLRKTQTVVNYSADPQPEHQRLMLCGITFELLTQYEHTTISRRGVVLKQHSRRVWRLVQCSDPRWGELLGIVPYLNLSGNPNSVRATLLRVMDLRDQLDKDLSRIRDPGRPLE